MAVTFVYGNTDADSPSTHEQVKNVGTAQVAIDHSNANYMVAKCPVYAQVSANTNHIHGVHFQYNISALIQSVDGEQHRKAINGMPIRYQ